MKASRFIMLVEKEDLPITVLHIHAATIKGTKSNSGGYEA